MRRSTTLIAAVSAAVLLAAPAAIAKGPTGATIEGEGINGAISIDEPGELGQGTPMSELVEAAGFFPLVFEPGGGPVEPPTTSLGLPLLITWRMGDDVVVEEIYLHAAGGPLAHVAPDQSMWEGTATTSGGWMRITGDIASPLVAVGVPEAAVAHLRPDPDVEPAPAEPSTPPAAAPTTAVASVPATAPAAARAPIPGPPSPAPATASRSVTVSLLAAAAIGAAVGVAAWRGRHKPRTH